MQIFLLIAGSGFLLLDIFVTGTILLGPVFKITLQGYGIRVFGTVLSAEIALLMLCAWCSLSTFLIFILAFRERRIRFESEDARQDLDPKLKREDSESKKALKELRLKKKARRDALLGVASAGLLLLGLASATVIFLIIVGRLPLHFSASLWLLFLSSTHLGVVAAWLAQQEKIHQIDLQKKQFWDERPTTQQPRTHRRRTRSRWRYIEKQVCYEDTSRWAPAHRRRARFRWYF